MQVKFRTIFKYFWLQIRKYKWSFFSVYIIWALAIIISDIILPLIYRKMIDIISNTELVLKTTIGPDIIKVLILVGIALMSYNILFRLGDFLFSYSSTNISRELNDDSFNRLHNHSYNFFINTFAGSLVTEIKRYTRAFHEMYFISTIRFWFFFVQVIGVLIALTLTHKILGGFFFLWIIIYLSITIWINIRKRSLDLASATQDSKLTGSLADAITNVLNIKIFGSLKQEKLLYASVNKDRQQAHLKEWNYSNRMFIFQGLSLALLEFVALFIALKLWIANIISTGTVVLIQLYINVIWHSLWSIGHAIMDWNRGIADASKLIEIFETPIEIKDPLQYQKVLINKGMIVINNINFQYGEGKVNIFENFSLTIPAGQRVGLVGHSGAGKSTITKLLLRFADVQAGTITVDGQDITKIRQDDLRSRIAYVPQDPILFHRSLRENIAYGKPKATKQEIITAAKKAHAHEFISVLPQGYDTLVGERGVKLSGGERQRVAIARAMLKDAPILMLDEATSSLDAISEKYIQDAFEELSQGRTTIVIAHRLSTIQKLDRIIVLESGKVAEEGTHQELIVKQGIYHNFWQHQTDGFIE